MANKRDRNGRNKNVIQQRARQREPLPDAEIKIRSPKQLPSPPAKPNLLTMLPMLVMALSVGVISFIASAGTGGARTLLTAVPMLLMVSMMLAVQRYSHSKAMKDYEAQVKQINEKYLAYLNRIRKKLEDYAHEQYRIQQKESPSFTELTSRVQKRAKTLWERQPTDNDFLAVRLGTGTLPLCIKVTAPEPDDEDPRLDLAQQLVAETARVSDLPVTANLNVLGSIGIRGQRSEALYTAFTMVANIAVLHSPDEVNIYIFSHRLYAAEMWKWARWLPHTNSQDGELGHFTHLSFKRETDEQLLLKLSHLLRRRASKRQDSNDQFTRSDTHVVVIFDQTPELRGNKVMNMLLAHNPKQDKNGLRASAIFIDQPIPPQVNAVVNVQGNDLAYHETWAADAHQINYRGTAELTHAREMERLARSMAPLHTEASLSEGKSSLPTNVRLVELLGATNAQHVKLDDFYSEGYDPKRVMAFPIGLDTDLKPLKIILRETAEGGYGAHAMLAGMTGTGKSVLLQAMVLSMALTNSPEHLNFVLADFKGGASELAKLQNLPHVVGFVTDLNEALVERFRIALESEIRRRKLLFESAKKKFGRPAANIRKYNQLDPDKPLPHLVAVLDEFAHGLQINPNLRKAMDTIAAQGRALGVHMVLSTQRAADFDNKIRPNVDVRMSLRVASAEDSKTMFNRPEASQLGGPGQAYLQVGDNEIFEMFQAARADIAYKPDGTQNIKLLDRFAIYEIAEDGHRHLLYKHKGTKKVDEDKGSSLSEAEVLVSHVCRYCEEKYSPPRIICLPPLPEAKNLPLLPLMAELPLYNRYQDGQWAATKAPAQRLRIPVGMLDLPAQQTQRPFILDLNERDGNFVVIGPGGAGKSLFLRSLILGLATTHMPDELHIYIFGRGPALTIYEELPHCGAVIQTTEKERMTRLLDFLSQTIKQRHNQMREARVSSMGTLRAANQAASLPAIIFILEDFAGFKVDHEDKLLAIQTLAGDAKEVDIHLIIASTAMHAIHTRIQDNLRNRLALGLTLPTEYMEVLGKRVPVLTEIKGRSYTEIDQEVLECQIAAPCQSSGLRLSSHEATAELKSIVKTLATTWDGGLPVAISTLAKHISLDTLWQKTSPASTRDGRTLTTAPIGLDYANLAPVTIDIHRLETVNMVIGPPQSGKTEFLMTLCLAIAKNLSPEQIEILLLAPRRNHLSKLRTLPHVRYAHTLEQIKTLLTEQVETLQQRTQTYQQAQAQLIGPDASGAQILPTHTILLIDDLQYFMRHDAASKLVDQCLASGQETGITIMIADTGNNLTQVKSQSFAVNFVQSAFRSGCGIVFSTDQNELVPLGLQFKLKSPVLRLHEPTIGRGRGFFAYQGQDHVVQIAAVGPKESDETHYQQNLEQVLNQIQTNTEKVETTKGEKVYANPTYGN